MPTRITLSVPAVSCAHCQQAIEAALAALPGVRTARVDLQAKTVTVVYDAPAARADIDVAIEEAGYEVAGPAQTSPS